MEIIEKNIGYTFKNKTLLQQALTHSSLTSNIHRNYERLEFLGDRILGLTIADMLYEMFPDEPEGNLAQRFAILVSKETVSEVVNKLDITSHIGVQMSEIRTSENVLCDIGEAIIAAIYLDSKDLKIAQEFIKNNFREMIDTKSRPHKDYKTTLQEVSHQKGYNAPIYTLLEKKGSEHEPIFLIKVDIGSNKIAQGKGKNKKQAEQNAAHEMLDILGIKD
jgi:ribonuclease-3